jgi:hypothetical protein
MATMDSLVQISHNHSCQILKQDTHSRKDLQRTLARRLQMNTHLNNLYYGHNFRSKPRISNPINRLSKACSKVAGQTCPQLHLCRQGLLSILRSSQVLNLGLQPNGPNRDSSNNHHGIRRIHRGMELLEVNKLYICVSYGGMFYQRNRIITIREHLSLHKLTKSH